jgi:hypothetical protein
MSAFGPPILDGGDEINAGLVGFWPLDEATGDLALDVSKYGWHGRGVSSPTTRVTPIGRAKQFDSNSYIQIRERPSRPVPVAFTYSMVLQGSGTLGNYAGLFAQTRDLSNNGGISLSHFAGNIVCYYDDNVEFTTGVALSSVFDGRPHFLAFGRAEGVDYTWLDGVLVRSAANAAGPILGLGGNLKIGNERSGTASFGWQNPVALFRNHDRLLRDSEVRRLYADPWAGLVQRRRRIGRGGSTALTLAIDPQAYEYAASDVGLSSARRIVADPLAYRYAPQDVGLSYRQGAHTLDVGALAYGYRPASVDLIYSGEVQPVGAASRTRRGARRVYLPEPTATAVFHPNALPEELAPHAVKAWKDDEDDEWFLLA